MQHLPRRAPRELRRPGGRHTEPGVRPGDRPRHGARPRLGRERVQLPGRAVERANRTGTSTRTTRSGAYGIPQALPGSKMATAGADWQTNPATQITWGLGYISARYGTPCGAWATPSRGLVLIVWA